MLKEQVLSPSDLAEILIETTELKCAVKVVNLVDAYQQKPVEDAEIAGWYEICELGIAVQGPLWRIILDALADNKRQLATMTARVEVADGQAAELDVQLSGAKREIGELTKRADQSEHSLDVILRECERLKVEVVNGLDKSAALQAQWLLVDRARQKLEGIANAWRNRSTHGQGTAAFLQVDSTFSDIREAAEARALLNAAVYPVAGEAPVPMQLLCPRCGAIHLDEGEWATRPHKTHQCQSCKHEWRPFEYPTVGVEQRSDNASVLASADSLLAQLLTVTNELEGERHSNEVRQAAINLLKAKLGEKSRGADGFGSTDLVAGEAPADTLSDPEVARLQGELEEQRLALELWRESGSEAYAKLKAERDQLATRQREMREALDSSPAMLNGRCFHCHHTDEHSATCYLTYPLLRIRTILDSPTIPTSRAAALGDATTGQVASSSTKKEGL